MPYIHSKIFKFATPLTAGICFTISFINKLTYYSFSNIIFKCIL